MSSAYYGSIPAKYDFLDNPGALKVGAREEIIERIPNILVIKVDGHAG
jgi:hypothetical protein